jgi:hypothetical protein
MSAAAAFRSIEPEKKPPLSQRPAGQHGRRRDSSPYQITGLNRYDAAC